MLVFFRDCTLHEESINITIQQFTSSIKLIFLVLITRLNRLEFHQHVSIKNGGGQKPHVHHSRSRFFFHQLAQFIPQNTLST